MLDEGLKDLGTSAYRRGCLVGDVAAIYSYLTTVTWKIFYMTSEESETKTNEYSLIENILVLYDVAYKNWCCL